MYRFFIILITLSILSCSKTADELILVTTLESYLIGEEFAVDNVIACAASHENDALISVFFYPRPGASSFKYFETVDTIGDKNDFENYSLLEFPMINVFNGFLKRFEVSSEKEKWVVVTFEEEGMIHISNPIKLKHKTKPTEYISRNVEINTSTTMPIFLWQDGVFDDTVIYFHVVSDAANNLLSGTYTFEQDFQYYNLDNVVLNITPETPPELISAETYHFTLLGVSEDNWVNLFSEVVFQIE